MVQVRRSRERGKAHLGWLDSKHTFSFGDYHDPAHMGFGSLRVINEDKVVPSAGFPTHPHRDMEIISYVLAGAIEHKDSMGTGAVIRPGEVQRMSAGTGVRHSEFNHSDTEIVHFFQIWIEPSRSGLPPSYQQQAFGDALRGGLKLVAAPPAEAAAAGVVTIHQDAWLYVGVLPAGQSARHPLAAGRRAWVQVARGKPVVNGQQLGTGDGASLVGEASVDLAAGEAETEVLVFDLA